MIWIIGGTSESRKLIKKLDNHCDYVVSIATEGGRGFFETKNLFVGRMTKDEMIDFAREKKITTLVDLSHPYAKIVSKNAKEAAKKLNIEYIRYARKKTDFYNKGIYLNSYEEAYEYLKNIEGTVFFTTGSKNIADFERVRGENRFIYRILPTSESIGLAEKENIHIRDLVAMLGPFSKELNKEMFKGFSVDYCVLKDSGEAGGTAEKIEACIELNIGPIIIGREEEIGYSSLDKILERIK